jgi:2',3'-cyclic-nucleotide 2'-phosphodiesterase (5'-nucleotidase family)
MNNLRLLHLNDLHSHLDNFPVIERFFAEKSSENVETLRFDLGDNVDRAHPLSEATEGKINVKLMNQLDLTAATIGNNEGLGLTHDMLSHLYDEANFPILLSNLETDFAQAEPMIVTTDFGLRIGLIGLTAPYGLAYPSAGWKLSDPFTILDKLVPTLREACDFVILLSHLGKPFDEKIAEKYEINLIIGSHTHHLFEHGAEVNGTLLAAAGKYGEYVGQIDLTFDEQNHLIFSHIEAIATNTLPAKKADLTVINGWKLQGHKLLDGTVLTDSSEEFSNLFPTFEASHHLADILAEYADVSACVINSGLWVADNWPEKITLDTLHENLPHSMRLVKFTFTGAELKQVIRELIDVSALLSGQQIRGMGFRGKRFGHLVLHGIEFRAGKFFYADKQISDEESYEVAMPDQYLFAYYFPLLKKLGKSEILFPYFLREIVAEHFKK